MTSLAELHDAGVSIWLDTIRRGLLSSGRFRAMIADDSVTGVTSNPTIFQKAITGSTDYDSAIVGLLEAGTQDPRELFFELGLEDIRQAADELRPSFEAAHGADGFASFEVAPDLAFDTAGTIAQAQELWGRLDRPNALIKVPATEAGIPAIEELIAEGVNVNVTLLFSVDRYEEAARAYIAGLSRRAEAGQAIDRVASVASFFVSRVDTAADRMLPDDSPLRGRLAVANARHAYRLFTQIFAGQEWDRLAATGAKVQRPLWASTGTKNPAYSDVLYVEELVAPDTVNTMPENTLVAFRDHGRVSPTIVPWLDDADRLLAQAAESGIDMAALTARLLEDGVSAFVDSYRELMSVIQGKVEAVTRDRVRHASYLPGGLDHMVMGRLSMLQQDDAMARIWSRDHTVWKPDPSEITDRLGWLTVHEVMQEQVDDLEAFAKQCAADGLTHVVLAGMGGSSLAPEVLRDTFGVAPGMLELSVLDTTNPDQIMEVEVGLDLSKTLFVIASKSGTTTETNSHFAYFWGKVGDGSRFVAITDPGTPLADLARARGFRKTFLNPPDIGGRYSALSYFGLVPGALIGADLHALLDRALEMSSACEACVPPGDNPGAWLGAVMAEAAKMGRDKLTLALDPKIASFGYWVEQLIAESTGKEGKGIVPIEGEPLGDPSVYGDDRMFLGVGGNALRARLEPLEHAGHPATLLSLDDPVRLGAEFFRWEFGTAVAGSVMGIQPFDQPNVQEAKDATRRMLASGDRSNPGYDDLSVLLKEVRSGDYLALLAYVPRNDGNERRLQEARIRLRDRLRVATTLGFGPRFHHSSGQLHLGGPNNGVFVQVIEEPQHDMAIPGEPYTFGKLFAAQSMAGLESLRAHGRRVARVRMSDLENV